MTVLADKRIGFIGAGNMASALIGGLVKSYLVAPGAIIASDIDPERRGTVSHTFGVRTTSDNAEVVAFADVVVLAVKPNVVARVLEEVGAQIRTGQIVISVCAGISSTFIQERLPHHPPVIRVMPNTAAQVGAGMSALAGCALAKPEHIAVAKAILGAVGEVIELEEKHLDAVTAISGSGPAYFFYLMEQMEAAGLAEGLPPRVAEQLVKQTALGAAKLCAESEAGSRELRRKVTSPGGTTEAAIYVLEKNGVGQLLVTAVREAAKRSRELGK
ncbi:MAG TPA: pyrroline-5-carboxylate reductase [Planctomycetota bacterium]|nr:pyrroline-5-carboxylate reductase [Planctomycetota bacterium]